MQILKVSQNIEYLQTDFSTVFGMRIGTKKLNLQKDTKKVKSKIKNSITVLAVAIIGIAVAQAQGRGDFRYYAQLNATAAAGKYAPYWFTANNNAVSPVDNISGYARYGMSYAGSFGKNGDFRYNVTADIIAGHNRPDAVSYQQAFGEFGWRWIRLSIGSKERWSEQEYFSRKAMRNALDGNNVTRHCPNLFTERLASLGTGGLTYSGNSRPIPQIRIEIPDFVDIPGTKEWLKYRGYFSYGIFSDNSYQRMIAEAYPGARHTKNVLYHGKGGFVSIGKPSAFPVTFDGGLEMHTQFGGTIYNAGNRTITMPHKFMDFFKAFIPMSGSGDTPVVEQTNISGNQIGSWQAAFTIYTRPLEIRIYGEHMFEDFSQLFFFEYQMNSEGKRRTLVYPWRDIQIGINIANRSGILPFISNVRYEYLTTRDQSGALYHDPSDYFNDQMDGCDNYYNHGFYPGWHHWGMGIGNPLVISPAYNRDGNVQFRSNRLIAHNVGINGIIGGKFPLAYRFNYTYSENWGTYMNPFSEKRYTTSLLAEITYIPKNSGWSGTLSLGCDRSSFIGNNVGAIFTITRSGSFLKK